MKVYLVADRGVRAGSVWPSARKHRRRHSPTFMRDESDAARMQPADDAEVIDTSTLDVEDVVADRGHGAGALDGMNAVPFVWARPEAHDQPVTKLFAPLRVYGVERIPPGGVVLAMNHFSWIDPPAFSSAVPRIVYFMAKSRCTRCRGWAS